MKHHFLKCLVLLCLVLLWLCFLPKMMIAFPDESFDNIVLVDPSADVSLRFAAQWEISKFEKASLDKLYGVQRVSFDQQGRPDPQGLSPDILNRWYRLYNLCMTDGCYYCDASEGSCETGTCGPQNSLCRPYVDHQGRPKCGAVCSDYAFAATLR